MAVAAIHGELWTPTSPSKLIISRFRLPGSVQNALGVGREPVIRLGKRLERLEVHRPPQEGIFFPRFGIVLWFLSFVGDHFEVSAFSPSPTKARNTHRSETGSRPCSSSKRIGLSASPLRNAKKNIKYRSIRGWRLANHAEYVRYANRSSTFLLLWPRDSTWCHSPSAGTSEILSADMVQEGERVA